MTLLKQAEIVYGQDFTIQILERRVAHLQGEKNNDELVELERRIGELKASREERTTQLQTLLSQYKRVEDETRKSKRVLADLTRDETYIGTKLAELKLHNTTAKGVVTRLTREKEDLMVNENIMKLDLNKFRRDLDARADEVLSLEKERLKLETGMTEKFIDIDDHQKLLTTQLRASQEEVQNVSSEFKERLAKVEKLKKRFTFFCC